MIALQKNIALAQFTTFGIGEPADYFCIATSVKDLTDAIDYARKRKIEFFVLGTGANILIGDKGFRGLVIKNESKKIELHENILTVESGVVIGELLQMTAAIGLSGLEHFAGIPSSVGGALWQNLHFLSPDRSTTLFIGDLVKSAVIYTENGQKKVVSKDFFRFSYDYSILHVTKDVVLTVSFNLQNKNKEEIKAVIENNLLWRNTKHPENAMHSSAGSVFKRIEGHGAGRLIEKVGLKGFRIGGAVVSQKHANFIINTGGASAKNVQDLISKIQLEVKNQLQLDMHTEISFIGEF